MNKTLHRSQTDKIVAGVCGGLADYFDIDSTIIRLLFILVVALGGSGVFLYLILWLIMPKNFSGQAVLTEERVKEFAGEIKERAQDFKEEVKIEILNGVLFASDEVIKAMVEFIRNSNHSAYIKTVVSGYIT